MGKELIQEIRLVVACARARTFTPLVAAEMLYKLVPGLDLAKLEAYMRTQPLAEAAVEVLRCKTQMHKSKQVAKAH